MLAISLSSLFFPFRMTARIVPKIVDRTMEMKEICSVSQSPLRIKRRLVAVKTFKIFSIETSLDAVSLFIGFLYLTSPASDREAKEEVEQSCSSKGWDVIGIQSRPGLGHEHQIHTRDNSDGRCIFYQIDDLID